MCRSHSRPGRSTVNGHRFSRPLLHVTVVPGTTGRVIIVTIWHLNEPTETKSMAVAAAPRGARSTSAHDICHLGPRSKPSSRRTGALAYRR